MALQDHNVKQVIHFYGLSVWNNCLSNYLKKIIWNSKFFQNVSTIDKWQTYERDQTGLSYIYDKGCTIRPNSPQKTIEAANATDCASKCKTDASNGPCTHFHYRPAGGSCIMRYGETSVSDVVRGKYDNDMICGIIIG